MIPARTGSGGVEEDSHCGTSPINSTRCTTELVTRRRSCSILLQGPHKHDWSPVASTELVPFATTSRPSAERTESASSGVLSFGGTVVGERPSEDTESAMEPVSTDAEEGRSGGVVVDDVLSCG